jgi:hypothetical protein
MIAAGAVLFLPFLFTSACQSSPLSLGISWLHEIHAAQLEARKGNSGAENTVSRTGYWRKDIRGLNSNVVNGRPAGLINRRIADSDIGEGEGNIVRPIPEISLRALRFVGEPPMDSSRYAVVMWVRESGRMGLWTMIASQEGVWGKPGNHLLEHFPANPVGEGWLLEAEVRSILSRCKRIDRWTGFWGF